MRWGASAVGGEKLQGGATTEGGFPSVGKWRWFSSGQTSRFPNLRRLASRFADLKHLAFRSQKPEDSI